MTEQLQELSRMQSSHIFTGFCVTHLQHLLLTIASRTKVWSV